MEIGKLNHRITILEHRTKIDGIGNHKTKWEEAFSLWAAVTVKFSDESDDTGVTKQVQTAEFLVRQSPSVFKLNSTQFRLIFRGTLYNIKGIIPYYDHNAYMKIQAVARKAGGKDDIG